MAAAGEFEDTMTAIFVLRTIWRIHTGESHCRHAHVRFPSIRWDPELVAMLPEEGTSVRRKTVVTTGRPPLPPLLPGLCAVRPIETPGCPP